MWFIEDTADDKVVGIRVEFEHEDSEKLRRVVSGVFRGTMSRFARKNRGYKSESVYGLGIKGEFVEINRKTGKLYQGIWQEDAEAFKSESAREVLEDLIGHCLLALDYLEQDELKKAGN